MRYQNTASGASWFDQPTFPTTSHEIFRQAAVHGAFRSHNTADLTLKASFAPSKGVYRDARCELPTGEVVEVRNRRTPFYDLARELQARGFGEWHGSVE